MRLAKTIATIIVNRGSRTHLSVTLSMALGIMQYQGQYGTDWGKVLAFVSLTLAPAVIFYLMAQKHIIAGLTSGAVKG